MMHLEPSWLKEGTTWIFRFLQIYATFRSFFTTRTLQGAWVTT